MARKKEITYWACDFETTVWTDEMVEQVGHEQDWTEVWAGADVALYDDTECVTITHSIRDFLTRFLRMSGNNVLFSITSLLTGHSLWIFCSVRDTRTQK